MIRQNRIGTPRTTSHASSIRFVSTQADGKSLNDHNEIYTEIPRSTSVAPSDTDQHLVAVDSLRWLIGGRDRVSGDPRDVRGAC